MFSGLTAEHANPTGLERRFQLQSLKPLARHFTIYAVNRKPGLPVGATIKDLAGHYAQAIARQFPGPVLVHGISTGGSIAQQFAIDHPQLVRRLVLAATACRLSPYGRGAAPVRRADPAGSVPSRLRRPRPRAGRAVADGRALAALMWLFGGGQRVEDPSDMLVTVAAEDTFDACPAAPHHRPDPAGRRRPDRFYSPELFRETAERIPHGRLRLYPGKGHAGVLTHKPAIREIVAFLRADDQPRT